jgi:phage terminase large subunit
MSFKLTFDSSNAKQEEAAVYWADSETEEILFGGSKNVGKSYLGAGLIFADALTYPDTRYFISRATLNDLVKQTVPKIGQILKYWTEETGRDLSRYTTFNAQRNTYVCYNKSEVLLLGCDFMPSDPMYERFGSHEYTRGWLEEGGEIPGGAKTNLCLAIGRWNNDKYGLKRKLLITCNPKKNWMKEEFIDPYMAGKLVKEKKVVLGNIYDNVHREKESEKVLENLKGIDRDRLLYGIWDYEDDKNSLMTSETIAGLYINSQVQKNGIRYITADLARFGKDKTVIFVWDGMVAIEIVIMIKNSVAEAVNTIQFLMVKYQIPPANVCTDDDGVGGGVTDYVACKGFKNGGQPIQTGQVDTMGKPVADNYQNLKSQCSFLLSDRVNKGQLYIECDLETISYDEGKSVKECLNQELENIKRKDVDDDRKLAVISKDEVKKIINRSPDYADAFMMRMYFELVPDLPVLVW